MSTPLHRLAAQARARAWTGVLLAGLPWAAALAVLAWRLRGMPAALLAAAVCVPVLLVLAAVRARRFDPAWAVRRLDAVRADLEDSSGLLLVPETDLGPLQRLQQARLRERVRVRPVQGLAPALPWRRLLTAGAAAMALGVIVLLWPARPPAPQQPTAQQRSAPVERAPGVVDQRLAYQPPAYTRVAAGEQDGLDARLPEGTQLDWRFRFDPAPAAAALVFVDGSRLELQRGDDSWRARHALRASALYRLEIDGAIADPAAAPHRLEAIADVPPQVQVIEPERSPVLVEAGQRRWAPVFEASDDYGLVGNARLRITLAQGSGENVTFHERSLELAGQGDATRRRYRADLDLAALNMGAGDDLVVQLEVRDNHSPQPQSTRSASVILRWPAHLDAAAEGLELLQRSVLPAYFRSQRQIIIDAEALQARKPRLEAERFVARSDAIGVDQRILRLRYGQFLGEEAEGAPKPPPAADADADAHEAHAGHEGHDDRAQGGARPSADVAAAPDAHDHAHADAPGQDAAGFGRESDVLAEYGHTHDHAEAATLLDPETRATLKQALDQMWQSELQLRQGRPDAALPFAHRALAFIKQVQQAERVFLPRLGAELPPIDESRRLGGKRDGIARAAWRVPARDDADGAVLLAAWQALAADAPREALDLEALQRWIDTHRDRIERPLDLLAALDSVRLQPACDPCRRDLRARLWSVLQRPPAGAAVRAPLDAQGGRYLRALQEKAR